MAKAGRSTIRSEIQYNYHPMPVDIRYKRFNFMWKADDVGRNIIEVGFRGQTGKATKKRGRITTNYELVEEYFEVAQAVYDEKTGKLLGYTGGTVKKANEVVEEFVIPRIRELFGDSEDVYPTELEEEEIEDGTLAPSVNPLPASGELTPTVKGKKVAAK